MKYTSELIYCSNCGKKVSANLKTPSEFDKVNIVGRPKILALPNLLFLVLFLFHMFNFLHKGSPVIYALASSIGVNIIPLAFGVYFNMYGTKKAKSAYVGFTILFIIIFIGAIFGNSKEWS